MIHYGSLHLEIEPLRVSLCVHIVLKPQVIFYIVYFDGSSQVAAFEAAVKDQYVVLLRHVDRV